MRMDYPKLAPVQEQGSEGYLIGLYEQLGWDKTSEVDPKRITINETQWKDISAEFIQAEGTSGGLFWMNYGPSADNEIPYGSVEIQDGAFIQTHPTQGFQTVAKEEETSIDDVASDVFDRRSESLAPGDRKSLDRAASLHDLKHETKELDNISELKTMDGWIEYSIKTGDPSIESYLKAGDKVAHEITNYFADVEPKTFDGNLLQTGAPYDLRPGDDGEKHPTYATFLKNGEEWTYCGPCFEGETMEPKLDPADREGCLMVPEYEYDVGGGDMERVLLAVGTYEFGINLFVGLQSFLPEFGCFDDYGDITVNVGPLPTLCAAIDTNNNGDKIVDFLKQHDIARDTDLTVQSGYCTYPVMEFNPTPLFRADAERTTEYLSIQGFDSDAIEDMKKAAFKDIEKKVVEPDCESLDTLKQEAKERTAEKNQTRPVPDKSQKPPAMGR